MALVVVVLKRNGTSFPCAEEESSADVLPKIGWAAKAKGMSTTDRKRRVNADGEPLREAIALLGFSVGARSLFGVSRGTWNDAKKKNASVTDKSLAKIFSQILDLATATGAYVQIYAKLEAMHESAIRGQGSATTDVARGGTRMPPYSPLPGIARLLDKRRPRFNLNGRNFETQMVKGNQSYRHGEYDEAVDHFEKALLHRPEDQYAKLAAAKAHLDARKGSYLEHWQRANQLIKTSLRRTDLSASENLALSFWAVVAKVRNPAIPDSPKKFADLAKDLEHNKLYLNEEGDRNSLNYLNLQIQINRFRSRVPKEQTDAKEKILRMLKSPTAYLSKYQQAIAHKILGNFYRYSDLTEETPVPTVDNLVTANAHYSKACTILKGLKRKIEWAQARYSQADTLVELGKLSAQGGPKAERRMNACFAKAKAACIEAIDALPPDFPEDRGRAQWNLAECYIHRPHGTPLEEATDLKRVLKLYDQVLKAFPRDYIESEWEETHSAIFEVCRRLEQIQKHDCSVLTKGVSSIKSICQPKLAIATYRRRLQDIKEHYERTQCGRCLPFKQIPIAPEPFQPTRARNGRVP